MIKNLNTDALFAAFTLFALVVHVALFATLHFLEPQISPASSIFTDYVYSNSPRLAVTAIFAFGLLWLGIAGTLLFLQHRALILNLSSCLFFIACIGIILSALFPELSNPQVTSNSPTLEFLVGGIARPGLFLGIILCSIGFYTLRSEAIASRILATLAVLIVIAFILTITVLLEKDIGGIGQRLVFVLIYAWVLALFRCVLLFKYAQFSDRPL